MKNLLDGIVYDVKFIKGHPLQPAWFKVLKIFLLPVVLAGSIWVFGWRRALVFAAVFLILMLIVHLVYRAGTRKFTRNWLDFVVIADAEKNRKPGIGAVYYASVLFNVLIAFLLSGALTG